MAGEDDDRYENGGGIGDGTCVPDAFCAEEERQDEVEWNEQNDLAKEGHDECDEGFADVLEVVCAYDLEAKEGQHEHDGLEGFDCDVLQLRAVGEDSDDVDGIDLDGDARDDCDG